MAFSTCGRTDKKLERTTSIIEHVGGANNRPMRSLIADLAGDRLGVARHAQAGSELLLVCLLCH